jgi:thioredoxin 1
MPEPTVELSELTFDHEIASGLWLVDFWAQWCAPCHGLAQTLHDLVTSSEPEMGSFRVGKVDVSANPALGERFEVRSLPTIVFFREGREVRRMFGAKNRRQLLAEMSELAEPVVGDPASQPAFACRADDDRGQTVEAHCGPASLVASS